MACAFKSTLQKGETKFSKVLAKIAKAEDAGKNVVDRLDVWKWQMSSLDTQVQGMKSGRQRPTFIPSPLPIVMFHQVFHFSALILPCPFCLRYFEPLWDCKLGSKHDWVPHPKPDLKIYFVDT
jgi:hypothetical protein